jgi:hypothetical protein
MYYRFSVDGERTGEKRCHCKTDLILGSRKTDELGMKFLDVFRHLFHSIPVKIQNLREIGI